MPDNYPSLRPEVISFALLMESVLKANDHKPGWKKDSPTALYRHLCEEMAEVEVAYQEAAVGFAAMTSEQKDAFVKELIDMANMAMMVADSLGYLDYAGKK